MRTAGVLVAGAPLLAWRAATADRPEAQLRAALDLALGNISTVGERAA